VHTLAFGGKGVARLNEFVIFVKGAVPGDVARVEIARTKKRYAEARLGELVKPSPDRVEPRCGSFGVCGGCVWQNLDYGVQLAYKARQVRESLEHLGGLSGFELRPIVGMANPWRYRNRVDFSIGSSPEGATVGFRPPGRWDTVLPLSECHLLGEGMEGVRATVESWLREKGLPGWDPRAGRGFARHLVVRSSQHGSQLLVSLVTGPGELPDIAGFVETLRSLHPEIVGITRAVNRGRAELSSGLDAQVLWGRPYLLEKVAAVTLKVSLNAFFQTNTIMAHELYRVVAGAVFAPQPVVEEMSTTTSDAVDHLIEEARAAGWQSETLSHIGAGSLRASGPTIWDLYCGVGSIGLSLAERAKGVLGIEGVSAAVEDARENARLNGIENADFIEGDVRPVLREVAHGTRRLPAGLERPDVIVVDPPRAGLSKKVVARVGRVGAPRIVYVSCNPSTMAPNIAQFQEHGYVLAQVTPVDMFPHTPHVEAVGLLVSRG
jgi:23S rRNA (uracil1939-C5)-methyltransferase